MPLYEPAECEFLYVKAERLKRMLGAALSTPDLYDSADVIVEWYECL